MRRQRVAGATTVEWLVMAMGIGVAMIVAWQALGRRVGDTVARGGDCVLALDGRCASGGVASAPVAGGRAPDVVPVADALPSGASVGASSLQWGAPGFTQGWTPAERERYLAEHGIADPDVNYFTPFWEHGPPNLYTGRVDTGERNTFGVIHDYNIGRDDWGWIGSYFDVVTPLTGRTHGDLDDAAARLARWLRGALRG